MRGYSDYKTQRRLAGLPLPKTRSTMLQIISTHAKTTKEFFMNRPPFFSACLVFVEYTNNEASVSADMSSFCLCTLADGIDPLK